MVVEAIKRVGRVIDMHDPIDAPSRLGYHHQSHPRTTTKKNAHLDDLPASRKLVLEFLLHARDHSRIVTLLYAILSTDDNVARLVIPKEEHFLRREGDHVHGGVVLKETTRAHVHLPDVEHFRVGHKALFEILLHRRPEHVICLRWRVGRSEL
jgi:hypothetical protein